MKKKYTDEQIIHLLQEYYNAHGKSPTKNVNSAVLGVSPTAIRKRFGSWNNALLLAKLPIKEYDTRIPCKCTQCSKSIKRPRNSIKTNVFCSKSCSATFNTRGRKHSKETKQKISKSLSKPKPIIGKHCRLFTCTCHHCKIKTVNRKQRKYCDNCKHLYNENGRSRYIFTFNVYDYPELFDLSLIEKYGWRSTKGKAINPNGITRDHKISVNESIRNNYDPYYIKHPLNCELMLFTENNKKNTNSSISYDKLTKMVDDFDKNWRG